MGRRGVIWRNKLENYIIELFNEHRKSYAEIAEKIQKEKGISLTRESIRNFINNKLAHDNTGENTVKQA